MLTSCNGKRTHIYLGELIDVSQQAGCPAEGCC